MLRDLDSGWVDLERRHRVREKIQYLLENIQDHYRNVTISQVK